MLPFWCAIVVCTISTIVCGKDRPCFQVLPHLLPSFLSWLQFLLTQSPVLFAESEFYKDIVKSTWLCAMCSWPLFTGVVCYQLAAVHFLESCSTLEAIDQLVSWCFCKSPALISAADQWSGHWVLESTQSVSMGLNHNVLCSLRTSISSSLPTMHAYIT